MGQAHGEHLEAWAAEAENSPVSELRGFAKGLRKDWAAVTAGLTLPYSSGALSLVVSGSAHYFGPEETRPYGSARSGGGCRLLAVWGQWRGGS